MAYFATPIQDPAVVINDFLDRGVKPDDDLIDDLAINLIDWMDESYDAEFLSLPGFIEFGPYGPYQSQDDVLELAKQVKAGREPADEWAGRFGEAAQSPPPVDVEGDPWWHPLSKMLMLSWFGRDAIPFIDVELVSIDSGRPWSLAETRPSWRQYPLFSEYASGWLFGLAAASNGIVLGEWLGELSADEVGEDAYITGDRLRDWELHGSYQSGQMYILFKADRRSDDYLIELQRLKRVDFTTMKPFIPTALTYCLKMWFHALHDISHTGLADDELHTEMEMEEGVRNVEGEYGHFINDDAPDNWAGQVLQWLINNHYDEETYSMDDSGAMPNEGVVVEALIDLGWIHPDHAGVDPADEED